MLTGKINVRRFVSGGIFTFALASLTSAHLSVRKAGYAIVGAYLDLLQQPQIKLSFKDSHGVAAVLTVLRNSVSTPFQRLPAFHVAFLAECATVMIRPAHPMFKAMSKFLARRPKLDLTEPTLVQSMMLNKDSAFASKQEWMLRIMNRGMQSVMDFAPFRRRHTFHLLMALVVAPGTAPEVMRASMHFIIAASMLFIPTSSFVEQLKSKQAVTPGDADEAVEMIEDDDHDDAVHANEIVNDAGSDGSDSDDDLHASTQAEVSAKSRSLLLGAVKVNAVAQMDSADVDGPVGALLQESSGGVASARTVYDKETYSFGLGVANYLRRAAGAVPWLTELWARASSACVDPAAPQLMALRVPEEAEVDGVSLDGITLDVLLLAAELLVRIFASASLPAKAALVRSEKDSSASSRLLKALISEVSELAPALSSVLFSISRIAEAMIEGEAPPSVLTALELRGLRPVIECLQQLVDTQLSPLVDAVRSSPGLSEVSRLLGKVKDERLDKLQRDFTALSLKI
jgi:hypothetical protein